MQLLPRPMEGPNIRPCDIRDSREPFAFGGRLDLFEGEGKIRGGDAEGGELGFGQWVWMGI